MSARKSAMGEQFCKNEGKWYVVVFTEYDEKEEEKDVVEAIPDFWLRENGEEAVWPPWKDQRKIIKAIASRKRPDENWLICKVKTVYWTQGCNTYAEATTKADLAEDTSDFNEEYERLANPANRKVYKRKSLFSDDDESNNCNTKRERKSTSKGVPKAKNEINFREVFKDLPDLPQQILIDTKTNKIDLLSYKEAEDDSAGNNESGEEMFSAINENDEQEPQDKENADIAEECNEQQIDKEVKEQINEDMEDVPAVTNKPKIIAVKTVNVPLNKVKKCTPVGVQHLLPVGKSGIFSLEKLNSMSDRELMVHLTLLCQTILTNQCRDEVKDYAKSNNIQQSDSLYELGMLIKQKFPLHTKEQFDAFNDHLKENQDFRRYFDTIGGKDGPAIARGILKLIIADSLGDLYSLKGQQDKLAFDETKFYHILEAAAINGSKTNNKMSDIRLAVGNWLKARKQSMEAKKLSAEKKKKAKTTAAAKREKKRNKKLRVKKGKPQKQHQNSDNDPDNEPEENETESSE